jgi:diguanylate cyclase (GGDEF)-like protein/PAS domain S-box-containing protein
MSWSYTPSAAILHATAVLSILLALMVARRKATAGAKPLILLMSLVAEWALASGLEVAAVGIASKLLWAKLEYLGAATAPLFFLIFSLEYRQLNRFLKPRYLLLYSIFPLIGIILAATNDWHHLFWNSLVLSPTQSNTLIYGHGVGFYALIFYDYLTVLVSVAVLLWGWIQARPTYRRQFSILLLGSVFPIAAGLIYAFGLSPFGGLDIPPISFLLSGIVLAIGILRFRLFELAPISRHTLVENMGDGILVVDGSNRIVDINSTAETILGLPAEAVLAKPAAESLKSWEALGKLIEANSELQAEIPARDDPTRIFNLLVKPLYQKDGELIGRLIVLRDVTSYQKTQTQLTQQNEELRAIESIALAITGGLDLIETIKTLHRQCSTVVEIDIFYVALYDELRALISVPIFYEQGGYRSGVLRDINEHPGLIGSVIRTNRTLYLRDNINSGTRPLSLDPPANQQPRSYVGIPLTVREKVVGAISIQNYRPHAYRPEQISLLERISVHAAIAIENSRLYAEVQRMAIVDELTGIYNYRGLLELGNREVERAHRFERPLSAIFFDIDGFREFNNTYSHTTGNLILQNVAHECRSFLRSVDILARFGGDEFVILLPETDLQEGLQVARRLFDRMAATKIHTATGELGITISVGISMLSENIRDLPTLVDHANRAEHQAKETQQGVVSLTA